MILSAGCCAAVAAFAPFATARARVAGFVVLPSTAAFAPPRRGVERRMPLGRVEMIYGCDVSRQPIAVASTTAQTNLVKCLVHCVGSTVRVVWVLGRKVRREAGGRWRRARWLKGGWWWRVARAARRALAFLANCGGAPKLRLSATSCESSLLCPSLRATPLFSIPVRIAFSRLPKCRAVVEEADVVGEEEAEADLARIICLQWV